MNRMTVSAAAMAVMLAAAAPAAAQDGYAIIFNNAKEDGGFNEAAFAGAERAAAEVGVSYRERISGDADETASALRAFANRGLNNLTVISFLNEGAVTDVAPEFADVQFTIVDGVVDAPNVRSVLFREEQAGYLAGAAAGLKTESNVVGFIGAISIPPIQRYGCGFIQGVATTNPDARVLTQIMGDSPLMFRDRSTARNIALEMIESGADILFPAAGFAGEGALDTIADAGGFGIGVDVNQNGYNDRMLTSAVKGVDQAVFLSWSDAAAGTWTAGIQRLGVAESGVDWAVDENNADLVADIRDQVDALKAELASGAREIADFETHEACAGL